MKITRGDLKITLQTLKQLRKNVKKRNKDLFLLDSLTWSIYEVYRISSKKKYTILK